MQSQALHETEGISVAVRFKSLPIKLEVGLDDSIIKAVQKLKADVWENVAIQILNKIGSSKRI